MTCASIPTACDSRAVRPAGYLFRRIVFTLTAVVLCYVGWAFAGMVAVCYRPAVLLAGLLGLMLLAAPWVSGEGRETAVWRDPVFAIGAAFLVVLGWQWANAGRVLFFDVAYNRWTYTPPPHPGWPSAFSRHEAAEMLSWFAPAWAIALAVRSRLFSTDDRLRLLAIVVVNAGALAVFGLVQLSCHAPALMWIVPLPAHFFASFGYENHAGAFFVLAGAIACGLVADRLLAPVPASRGTTVTLAFSAVLCLIGANLSLSRAGVILAWVVAAAAALVGVTRAWPCLSPARRLNTVAATLGSLALCGFAVAALAGHDVGRQFEVRRPGGAWIATLGGRMNLDPGARRLFLDRVAWQLCREHPWIGVGGWGFRYLLPTRVSSEALALLRRVPGYANVHCDPLQFLCEFGLIGCGLMAAAVMAILRPVATAWGRLSTTAVLGLCGGAMVVVDSLVDIPFRCPAILLTWVAAMAAVSLLPAASARQSPGILRKGQVRP